MLTLEREDLDGRLARRGLRLGPRRDDDTPVGELLEGESIERTPTFDEATSNASASTSRATDLLISFAFEPGIDSHDRRNDRENDPDEANR